MKKLFTLLTILCAVAALNSCYYDKYNELNPKTSACDTSGTVTYTKQVAGVISSYCYSCHNPGLQNGGYDFSTYDQVKACANSNNILVNAITANGQPQMPQTGPMSDCNIAIIKKWVATGCQK